MFKKRLLTSLFSVKTGHKGLDGKTPAEACGITVQGKNKWKTLMENASRKQ